MPQVKLRVSLNPVLPRLLFIYCLKIVWLQKWGPSLFLAQLFLLTPTGFEEMAATIAKNIICSHLLFFFAYLPQSAEQSTATQRGE